MKLTPIIDAIALTFLLSTCYGMDAKLFNTMTSEIQKQNPVNLEKVAFFLQNNETQYRQDPDYYVILLNYVITNSETPTLLIGKEKPQKNEFAYDIKERKSGKTVGFIRDATSYNNQLIAKGILKTQKALPYFKSRLDIQLGVIAAAERAKRWDIIGDQLVEILTVSKEINNHWTWGSIGSIPDDSPKHFMLESVQAKISLLFRIANKTADEAVFRASQALIKYYPDSIYGYANMGALCMANKKYIDAEKYFKQAQRIDPKDEVVTSNLENLRKKLHENHH